MLCEFLEEEPEGIRCCSGAGSFLPRILSVNTNWQTSARLLFPTTLTFPKPLFLGHMKRKAAHLYGLAKLRKCGSVGLHGHRVWADDITVTLVNNSGDTVDLAVVQDWKKSMKKKTASQWNIISIHEFDIKQVSSLCDGLKSESPNQTFNSSDRHIWMDVGLRVQKSWNQSSWIYMDER